MSTQAEILARRYAELQKKGVMDIKFQFAPLGAETVEGVCGSVNEALDAMERGDLDDLPPLGDSRPKK